MRAVCREPDIRGWSVRQALGRSGCRRICRARSAPSSPVRSATCGDLTRTCAAANPATPRSRFRPTLRSRCRSTTARGRNRRQGSDRAAGAATRRTPRSRGRRTSTERSTRRAEGPANCPRCCARAAGCSAVRRLRAATVRGAARGSCHGGATSLGIQGLRAGGALSGRGRQSSPSTKEAVHDLCTARAREDDPAARWASDEVARFTADSAGDARAAGGMRSVTTGPPSITDRRSGCPGSCWELYEGACSSREMTMPEPRLSARVAPSRKSPRVDSNSAITESPPSSQSATMPSAVAEVDVVVATRDTTVTASAASIGSRQHCTPTSEHSAAQVCASASAVRVPAAATLYSDHSIGREPSAASVSESVSVLPDSSSDSHTAGWPMTDGPEEKHDASRARGMMLVDVLTFEGLLERFLILVSTLPTPSTLDMKLELVALLNFIDDVIL
mmetsp:Transcript_51794/g.168353  ORF Transcript_51794/g.168353 Transcript_51794/m.168353 type:complete len:447 (-) Transcript_51794:722-2062(-)